MRRGRRFTGVEFKLQRVKLQRMQPWRLINP